MVKLFEPIFCTLYKLKPPWAYLRFRPFLAYFLEPLLVQFEDPLVQREDGENDESLEPVEDDVGQHEDLLCGVERHILLIVGHESTH